jgi:IS1 family transposase
MGVSLELAVARDSGLLVGQAVSPDRGLETVQAVADRLPAARRYTSDGHVAYSEDRWPEGGQPIGSVGKEEPCSRERVKAKLPTSLKRLRRRSGCFSRSLEALRRAERLFVSSYQQRQRLYLAHPAYHGRLPLLF